jgi:hypothetical protein
MLSVAQYLCSYQDIWTVVYYCVYACARVTYTKMHKYYHSNFSVYKQNYKVQPMNDLGLLYYILKKMIFSFFSVTDVSVSYIIKEF